ncbi:hypothetical protein P153DRAFT_293050 [Dothidotthia symphoricarpi CBS 119687]|uniref:Cation/H+ exchanger transmembrane domain-containing protein n=1 Tax=Dothidotthia symphoricarpi CBS 119687 TaxID=1392245 RepID=A0A6A6A9D1_9PLEO|nr:uncharacterized protein P153DRAFT_293050 [Dothidotthia symphoricarpi CBS 119687]KAF2128420.1 hypothetical protein P153DRAFT_293050 [Dothidotthia symphoricarpi CBS 119687]
MDTNTSGTAASLPYHEPDIITILVQTSFLLLLNIVNAALDRVLYCGLLGQVVIGIAWGTPGAKWLSVSVEETIVQLGYLGLILLVYEGLSIYHFSSSQAMSYLRGGGGLHTSFQSLKANLLLSSGVALTGIIVPIGLSYTLQGLLDATPVQAFAAGAALCSTSLGTTFTVLGSSGLSSSRLGVVLTSAAMMDDVVGLVMVQVISNLGNTNFSWVIVVRPVLVSIAFAVIVPLVCLFLVKAVTIRLNELREAHPTTQFSHVFRKTQTAFVIHTLLLIGLVAGATYAGTSNLFAAYIAGATISWWDSEVPHVVIRVDAPRTQQIDKQDSGVLNRSGEASPKEQPIASRLGDAVGIGSTPQPKETAGQDVQTTNYPESHDNGHETRGAVVYQRYYHEAVSRILQPLFFASVGFSIPITRMFKGYIVWRGVVYTVLMASGKLVCGLWLVRFSSTPGKGTISKLVTNIKPPSTPRLWRKSDTSEQSETVRAAEESTAASAHESRSSPNPPKPVSLYPPLILALAMCARGEIGFLVSGVAESNGVFSPSGKASDEPSDIFLVATWAIVLCTILGPLGVGLSVRRVKTLQEQKNKQREGAGRDVLGVWGVE